MVDVEELKVGENEIDTALDQLVAPLQGRSQELRKRLNTPAGRRSVALDLLTDKAVDRLVAIAKGEAPEIGVSSEDGDAAASESPETREAPADVDPETSDPDDKNTDTASGEEGTAPQLEAKLEPASDATQEPPPSEE